MLYGEELHVIEAANSDSGTMTAINLTASLGDVALIKTMPLPGVAMQVGFRVVTAFTLGTGPTPGVLELFRYPYGLVANDLPSAIAMYNWLTLTMNAHAADLTMHAAVDTDFSATLSPTTPAIGLTDLMVGLNLLQTAYTAHNTDSQQGSPTFHVATGANHALADTTPVSTLATSIAKLNDMVAKYNLHDLGLTMHYVANLHPAVKVSLGTLLMDNGYPVGKIYKDTVNNKVPDTVPAAPGIAHYNVGDAMVVQCTKIAVGGTKAGTLQPFIVYSNRGENKDNQPQLVDMTPAVVGY